MSSHPRPLRESRYSTCFQCWVETRVVWIEFKDYVTVVGLTEVDSSLVDARKLLDNSLNKTIFIETTVAQKNEFENEWYKVADCWYL